MNKGKHLFKMMWSTPKNKKKTIAALVAVAVLILLFIIVPNMKENTRQESTQNANATVKEKVLEDVSGVSLDGKKIIVDAGHGGSDVGCIGVETGRYEKEVNLEIAQKLERLLVDNGAEVIMTRTTDDAIAQTKEEDMAQREQIIKTSNADMFVSIHQNEFENKEAKGPQVFFVAQGSVGKRLAVAIQERMNGRLDPDGERIALPVAYRLLKVGSQPSCIVECGFFSNPQEEKLLQEDEYQQKVANTILDGIKLYVKRFPE